MTPEMWPAPPGAPRDYIPVFIGRKVLERDYGAEESGETVTSSSDRAPTPPMRLRRAERCCG
jgi:hypothetical protein